MWRRKGEGGKQCFKAGTSQLQGESLNSGQGDGHPRCLCSMDAQTSSAPSGSTALLSCKGSQARKSEMLAVAEGCSGVSTSPG